MIHIRASDGSQYTGRSKDSLVSWLMDPSAYGGQVLKDAVFSDGLVHVVLDDIVNVNGYSRRKGDPYIVQFVLQGPSGRARKHDNARWGYFPHHESDSPPYPCAVKRILDQSRCSHPMAVSWRESSANVIEKELFLARRRSCLVVGARYRITWPGPEAITEELTWTGTAFVRDRGTKFYSTKAALRLNPELVLPQ